MDDGLSKDFLGNTFELGDKVAHSKRYGAYNWIDIGNVTGFFPCGTPKIGTKQRKGLGNVMKMINLSAVQRMTKVQLRAIKDTI